MTLVTVLLFTNLAFISSQNKSIRPNLSLGMCVVQLFDEAPQGTFGRLALNLVAVLYYYASHYSAFLYHAKRCMWDCVDDSYVREVKCILCH